MPRSESPLQYYRKRSNPSKRSFRSTTFGLPANSSEFVDDDGQHRAPLCFFFVSAVGNFLALIAIDALRIFLLAVFSPIPTSRRIQCSNFRRSSMIRATKTASSIGQFHKRYCRRLNSCRVTIFRYRSDFSPPSVTKDKIKPFD